MSLLPEHDAELKALLEVDAATLYDDAPSGYATLLPSGEIVRLNRTLAQWIGFDSQALIGKRFQSLMTVGGRIYYETHCAPLLAMQGYLSEIAIELMDRGANVRPVLIAARAQRGSSGTIRVIRLIVFDASERRRYERELLRERRRAEESLRAKAELIRMLSHDVRAPLATIRNVATLLGAEADPLKRQRQLAMLNRASDGILALVNQILDFERLDAGQQTLDVQPIDLRSLLETTIEQFSFQALEKNLELSLILDDVLPPTICGDSVKLTQIMANLVGNAIKFTEKGRVTVWVRACDLQSDQASLEISVEDSGIGIPEDRLGAIFEAFSQASADIGRQYGGSGLGLAISRRLVELHGSVLQVQSQPGLGSRFWFRLKVSQSRG